MDGQPSIEFIQNFLMQYKGGQIKLVKDYWEDGIALMCISNVEKKNAISGTMMVDLRNCVLELENWSTGKALILYGEGTNFCSGGDLDFAKTANNPTAGFYMSYYMHEVLRRFRCLPLLSVSLVHGPVLGGGAELSVYSDFIVASDDVKLGFVHGKMGLMTAWGGTTRLVEMLGARKAMEMLLQPKIYSAQECLDLGFASKIVKESNKLEGALEFVKSFAVYDSSIIQSYKTVINSGRNIDFEGCLDVERNEFYPKWGSELNKEALNKRIKHINYPK